jgi:hypothetical protein
VSEKKLEPWQWTESHWRQIVDHVRAGKKLVPSTWPNGARLCHCIIF